MLGGVALLGEVLVVIGVENRMVLHRHLVVGDEVEVSGGEERGIVIVTMITGGYHRLEGIVTLHLPGVVDVEAAVVIVETAEVAGEGRGIRDLVVRPAETPDTIERAANPDRHTRKGALCGIS